MKGFDKWMNILALNKSNCIVTNSIHLNDFVIKFFRQKIDKVNVIYNGIEYSESGDKSGDDNISLGIIGKDTKAKNILLFMVVANNLIQKHQNVSFYLCGKGLDANSCFFKIIPEDIRSKFIFYGEIEDTSTFFNKLNIYLSTSNSEGLPNAIMEAMSFAIPVIATNVGGVSELVQHNKTGFLVRKGDKDAIIDCCNTLIENRELGKRMGRRGQQLVRSQFPSERMVSKFEHLFDFIA